MKKGRWTDEEKAWFKKNINRLTDEELSAKLDRSIESIKEAKKRHNIGTTRLDIEQKFEQSHQWKLLNDELTEEEMEFFTTEFAHLTNQFQGDILPIEESQMFILVKNSVMQHRVMAEKKRSEADLVKARKIILDTLRNMGPTPTEEEKQKVSDLKSYTAQLESANKMRTAEYLNLTESYRKILNDLKATRNQRLEKVENNRKTFIDTLKYLDEKRNKDKEGEFLEMFKKGVKKEYAHLTSYHTYADGEMEKPILNVDTMEDA